MTKIYIVDDDPSCLTIMSTKLWQNGYTVRTFESVENVLPHLKDGPDLIILDHNFKNTQTKGSDYIPLLKRGAKNSAILYITSETSPEVINSSLISGADMCIKKDNQVYFTIHNTVESLLKKKRAVKGFWSKIFCQL